MCGTRPTREHVFDSARKWRFDLAFPTQKLAIEVEGRYHLRTAQHRKDCEKKNAALTAGWRILTFPASTVLAKCRRNAIVEQIYRTLCGVWEPELDADVITGKL